MRSVEYYCDRWGPLSYGELVRIANGGSSTCDQLPFPPGNLSLGGAFAGKDEHGGEVVHVNGVPRVCKCGGYWRGREEI
jgi:hypothetical protein